MALKKPVGLLKRYLELTSRGEGGENDGLGGDFPIIDINPRLLEAGEFAVHVQKETGGHLSVLTWAGEITSQESQIQLIRRYTFYIGRIQKPWLSKRQLADLVSDLIREIPGLSFVDPMRDEPIFYIADQARLTLFIDFALKWQPKEEKLEVER